MSEAHLVGKAAEFDAVNNLLKDLNDDASLETRVLDLVLAGRQVVNNWESGDLALAVRRLNSALSAFKDELPC